MSSADAGRARAVYEAASGRMAAGELPLSPSRRAVMVLCGFVPLLHVVFALAPLALTATGQADLQVAVLSPILLYVAPALVVRAAMFVRPLRPGAFPAGSPPFLWWWFTIQWQVLFSRLPILEELLRVVPGLYSAWLRLWGSRVGPLVYWSPGVAITDRSLLDIGGRVVFGMGVRLNPHALAPDANGRPQLYLAPIRIGADTLVGGYSLVLAGCQIAAGEVTPALKTLHPFTRLERGRRSAVEGSPLVAPREVTR